jgi:drug/metabolite transporter (DMT)-like permease
MNKRRAIYELLVADFFWGFSFVAVPMAHKSWDSAQISFLRFAIPVAIGLTLGLLNRSWRLSGLDLRLSFWPGLFFAATIYAQTIGLEYTSPSKSSFITVLYVIFVPLLETYLRRAKLTLLFWMSIASSFVGLLLLFNLRMASWNLGDSITLICALSATWHIFQISRVARKFRHPILFNLSQCFWASLFLLPMALLSSRPMLPAAVELGAVFGLAMVAFGATTVAFSIQARAQPYLSLTTSSLIFLLESPIAMFFSWLIIHEEISKLQMVGTIIILGSCIIAIRQSNFSAEHAFIG